VKDDTVLIKEDIELNVNKIKNSNGKNIWLFGAEALLLH
jgi:hypothetical protein